MTKMSKSDELKRKYRELELDTPKERKLLSKVKDKNASNEEVNSLLTIVTSKSNGARKLDDIKNFENQLVEDFNNIIDALEEMENEVHDVANCDDELEIESCNADMKKRYRNYMNDADEILEAMRIAYFQIKDFDQFENRLYNAKEPLGHLE